MSNPQVGDRGQRYEVSFFNPNTNSRMIMGWSDEQIGVDAMFRTINLHPSWNDPNVRDRYDGGTAEDLHPEWNIRFYLPEDMFTFLTIGSPSGPMLSRKFVWSWGLEAARVSNGHYLGVHAVYPETSRN